MLSNKIFIQASLWHSYSEQEFVYVGDAGIVEPSGSARRFGFDGLARYQINKWLYADIDLNINKARSLQLPKGENFIPLAPLVSSIGGITAKSKKGINASLRYRYLGDRPANEDYSQIAKGYFLVDGLINYKIKKYEFSLSVENMLNKQWKETQFETTSKLKNEPNPFTEIHYTPGSPFFIKAGVTLNF